MPTCDTLLARRGGQVRSSSRQEAVVKGVKLFGKPSTGMSLVYALKARALTSRHRLHTNSSNTSPRVIQGAVFVGGLL